MNHLGNYLKKRLRELNVSEREMAQRCQMSHSYLNQLIKGINPKTLKPISPTVKTLERLSSGLNVSTQELDIIMKGRREATIADRMSYISHLEANLIEEGLLVGSQNDRVIPNQLWQQIKEAQDFMACIGVDPSQQKQEDWENLLKDIQLVVDLHLKNSEDKPL